MSFDTKEIDHGVPVPPNPTEKYARLLRAMKPGDSIVLDLTNRNTVSTVARNYFGTGNYTTRRLDDGRFRVWRTA